MDDAERPVSPAMRGRGFERCGCRVFSRIHSHEEFVATATAATTGGPPSPRVGARRYDKRATRRYAQERSVARCRSSLAMSTPRDRLPDGRGSVIRVHPYTALLESSGTRSQTFTTGRVACLPQKASMGSRDDENIGESDPKSATASSCSPWRGSMPPDRRRRLKIHGSLRHSLGIPCESRIAAIRRLASGQSNVASLNLGPPPRWPDRTP